MRLVLEEEKKLLFCRNFFLCPQVIKYSVKTGSPNFHNQMFGGIDTYAMGGSWLGDALNTSMYTFEMAPVFNVMEEAVIDWMLELVGWKAPDGPRKGEGIFTAGKNYD